MQCKYRKREFTDISQCKHTNISYIRNRVTLNLYQILHAAYSCTLQHSPYRLQDTPPCVSIIYTTAHKATTTPVTVVTGPKTVTVCSHDRSLFYQYTTVYCELAFQIYTVFLCCFRPHSFLTLWYCVTFQSLSVKWTCNIEKSTMRHLLIIYFLSVFSPLLL